MDHPDRGVTAGGHKTRPYERTTQSGVTPAVARRASGGTLVLHDEHHLGFSVALPLGHALGPTDVLEAYRRLNLLVALALETLGATVRLLSVAETRADTPDPLLRPACYGGWSPFEIVARLDRKLVGSAQLRRRGVVLHEGGILLRFNAAETSRWLAADSPAESDRRAALLAARVTDLEHELGRAVTLSETADALTRAIGPALGAEPPLRRGLSPAESAHADELRRTKYADRAWTARR